MHFFSRSSRVLDRLLHVSNLRPRLSGSLRLYSTDSISARLRSVPPNGYVLLTIPCITLYLGIWQIKRRKWKLGLIEELDRKRRLPGVEMPHDLSEIGDDREYETFILYGEFDHSRETYIGPRSLLDDSAGGGLLSSSDSVGVHVITPMKLSGRQEQVLVNRGWISMRQKKDGALYRPTGEQKVVGVYRRNERGSSSSQFDLRTSMWSRRDVSQLSEVLETSPVYFDAAEVKNQVAIAGSPIPGQTVVQLRNEHLSYIITWFSLTLLLTIVWARRFLRPRDYKIEEMLRQADRMRRPRP